MSYKENRALEKFDRYSVKDEFRQIFVDLAESEHGWAVWVAEVARSGHGLDFRWTCLAAGNGEPEFPQKTIEVVDYLRDVVGNGTADEIQYIGSFLRCQIDENEVLVKQGFADGENRKYA